MFNNNIRKEIAHLRWQGLKDNEVSDKLSEKYKNMDFITS